MKAILLISIIAQLVNAIALTPETVSSKNNVFTGSITPGSNQKVTTENITNNVIHFTSDDDLHDLLQVYANTSSILVNTTTNVAYSDIVSVPEVGATGNSTYGKRDYMTNYDQWSQTWKQWKIANHGDWWSPWYQISICIYTGNSAGEAEYSINWSYSYGWGISYGGSIG